MGNNLNLASTHITDRIRISTGLAPSSANGHPFTYVETWIFSDDPRVKSKQRIHGTVGEIVNEGMFYRECPSLYLKALIWHCKVARALQVKYGGILAEAEKNKARLDFLLQTKGVRYALADIDAALEAEGESE